VPLGMNFYHPTGFSGQLKASYFDQKGKFQPQNYLPEDQFKFISGEDRFWVVDAEVRYRLPKRYGLVSFGVKNLFDKSFNFQDTDPINPVLQPARLIYGKLTITF
jgi:outer membrane receptor protein involved in Fe transport